MEDRVPQARIYKIWNVPQNGSSEFEYLDLVSDVLGAGKNSRLYTRLVYRDQIATAVSSSVDAKEIGALTISLRGEPQVNLSEAVRANRGELWTRAFEGGVEVRLGLLHAPAGAVRRRPDRSEIRSSVTAPEVRRIAVKPAASISGGPSASRHRMEFAAKAVIASAVATRLRSRRALDQIVSALLQQSLVS